MIINPEKIEKCNTKVKFLVKILEGKYKTVTVNSGFRTPEENKADGGVTHSQHLLGNAVDISVQDVSCIKVAAYVLDNIGVLNVRGIGLDVYKNYAHFDFRNNPTIVYWTYTIEGEVA